MVQSIKTDLEKRLENDGFENISEAIGLNHPEIHERRYQCFCFFDFVSATGQSLKKKLFQILKYFKNFKFSKKFYITSFWHFYIS